MSDLRHTDDARAQRRFAVDVVHVEVQDFDVHDGEAAGTAKLP